MLTTMDIADRLLSEAAVVAASEQTCLAALVEDGLRVVLAARCPGREPPGSVPDAAVASPAVTSLTPRERDVIRLLVQGRTNRQIAQTLGLATKTVEKRVSNILLKLGFEHRSQVAAWAVARGLAAAPVDQDTWLWQA